MKAKPLDENPAWVNVLEWVGLALLLVAILAWQSMSGYEIAAG